MKVRYSVDSKSRIVFELDGATCKDIFREVAEIQEIFEADRNCGLCGEPDIRYRVRAVDDNEFFELVCGNCQATLPIGQKKDGKGLFPKRKGQHHGWREAWTGQPDAQPEDDAVLSNERRRR